MTHPMASSISPISSRRDLRWVLRTHGDFSSPLARLTGTTHRGAPRGVGATSTQVIDRLHVRPTAFRRGNSEVMVIGLHSHPATQGASAAMFGFRRIPSLLRMSALDDGTVELSSWNRAARLPIDQPGDAEAVHASGTCTCELAHPAGVYNEEAFHYLLTVEYKR